MRDKLSYANVVATIALIVAVAGIPTAVAVTAQTSKKADVTSKGNIRAGRVTTGKLADNSVTAPKLGFVHSVQATGTGSAHASCPAGERILSGGGFAPSGTLVTDTPGNAIQGPWEVAAQPASATVTAVALCLKATFP
jgi:hypothetical protein